jgi:deoxyribodipyrimidine photo-lyase
MFASSLRVKNITDVNAKRVRQLKLRPTHRGPVVYWMSRDQRVDDNWALLYAIEMAQSMDERLVVAFCLVPDYMGATWRQYGFMIKGLKEVQAKLLRLGIGFELLLGHPWIEFPSFLHRTDASMLIADFDPVRIKIEWKKMVVSGTNIPAYEVDAHNVVPCWAVSNRKIETLVNYRAKLMPLLEEFNTRFPEIRPMKNAFDQGKVDWDHAIGSMHIDMSVPEVNWLIPGEEAAQEALSSFCRNKLSDYPLDSMNPLKDGQSNLSPYLHFGQLSAQRVALSVKASDVPENAKSKFIDQLIVKREIADNFCLHNPNYDTFGGFPEWAKRSIDEHRSDPREHVYTMEQFEKGETHDPLWNAAQTEMVKRGRMHGSLRPYWASKILEWSRSPEEAYDIALRLNDRYQLDGRDASGYSGIAMVIGGLYDRPWKSKEVMGKVKKLTYTGQRMRFDVHGYYEMVKGLK